MLSCIPLLLPDSIWVTKPTTGPRSVADRLAIRPMRLAVNSFFLLSIHLQLRHNAPNIFMNSILVVDQTKAQPMAYRMQPV